jgi:hypothetical protein
MTSLIRIAIRATIDVFEAIRQHVVKAMQRFLKERRQAAAAKSAPINSPLSFLTDLYVLIVH